jgi:hypothetical protein
VKGGRTIFLPEGEKDVDALVRLGLDATTNAGGPRHSQLTRHPISLVPMSSS